MNGTTRPLYDHRQVGWPMLGFGLAPLACLFFFVRGAEPANRSLPPELLPLIFVLVAIAIAGFSTLRVIVTTTHLQLRFGPGLYRRTVALDDIADATQSRSRWYEGWGVHVTFRGMLYNVGGFDTVRVVLTNGRSFRIGSDEADRLRAAIDRARDARRRERR